MDNVLVAYEILHSLKSKRSRRYDNFVLKLDIRKVYDKVEWGFLKGMIQKSGFDDRWTSLVMNYVTSISYIVGINCCASNLFIPSRALRQRDPLSHLFLLCAKGFFAILNEAKKSGMIQGAQTGRERLAVNHLFFTDDNVLFGRATREGTLNVHNAILV